MDHSRPKNGNIPNSPDDRRPACPFDAESYENHKSAISLIMGHFLLRHLNLLYQAFDGDLLMPIVLGEIAHHNVVRFYSGKGDCMAVRDRVGPEYEPLKNLEPSNAFSISEATGIPRETVRRKIDKLIQRGWLVKNARGEVTISDSVSHHFTKDFNKILLKELLEASACINRLLTSE